MSGLTPSANPGDDSQANLSGSDVEIPSEEMDELLHLLLAPSSDSQLQEAISDHPNILDLEWLLDVSDQGRIEGLLLMLNDPEETSRIRIGMLVGQYLDVDFWAKRAHAAIEIAEEHLELVDVPIEGLTIEWRLAERSDSGDTYKPYIQEFAPHLKPGQDGPLATLHQMLLTEAHLRPILV